MHRQHSRTARRRAVRVPAAALLALAIGACGQPGFQAVPLDVPAPGAATSRVARSEDLQPRLRRIIAQEMGYSQAAVAQEFAETGLTFEEAVEETGYTVAELSAMTDAQLRSLVRQTLDHYEYEGPDPAS